MVVVMSSTIEKMKTLPYGFGLEECKLGTHAEELSARLPFVR
jgi:hypothetical protein